MGDQGYNGWANYPTWCIHLWITNEEGDYNYWREQADHGLTICDGNTKEAAGWLADTLKDEWRGDAGEDGLDLKGFWADLMGYALDQVDWREVAEVLIDELPDS